MSTIDSNGFTRDRYETQRANLAARWQESFPTSLTDSKSVPGRIISITAELSDLADAKIQVLLDQFDPRSAVGNALSNLAPLMNKRRRPAVKSSVVLTVGAGVDGCTIPSGSIVAQSAGAARFVTTRSVVVAPSSTTTVPAEATVFGAVIADAGSVDTIITPIFGWLTVTNADAANVGRVRDTDGVLRGNMLATSSAAVGTPEGIITALLSVPGVTFAEVYDNKTDVIDALGLRPHSVFPIVDGGDDNDIALALLASVAEGIPFNNIDDLPDADWRDISVQNPANLQNEIVSFSRPVPLPIDVVVNIETDADFPADGEQRIETALLEFIQARPIGRKLYASRLYDPVNTVAGVDINSITIDGIDRVVPDPFEKITLIEADITINIV